MTTATPARPHAATRIRVPRVARSRPRPRVSSLPFLALIAGLLGAALIALLLINNSLAAGSFEQARLKGDQILLGEQEQALNQEVERLSSPTRLREAARQAGLVAAATTAYIDLTTGEILGVPKPATAGGAAPGLTPAEPLTPGAAAPSPGAAPSTAPTAPTAPTARTAPTAPAPAAPGAAVATPAPDGSDGAAVSPGGVTAYDRAVVSGGGR